MLKLGWTPFEAPQRVYQRKCGCQLRGAHKAVFASNYSAVVPPVSDSINVSDESVRKCMKQASWLYFCTNQQTRSVVTSDMKDLLHENIKILEMLSTRSSPECIEACASKLAECIWNRLQSDADVDQVLHGVHFFSKLSRQRGMFACTDALLNKVVESCTRGVIAFSDASAVLRILSSCSSDDGRNAALVAASHREIDEVLIKTIGTAEDGELVPLARGLLNRWEEKEGLLKKRGHSKVSDIAPMKLRVFRLEKSKITYHPPLYESNPTDGHRVVRGAGILKSRLMRMKNSAMRKAGRGTKAYSGFGHVLGTIEMKGQGFEVVDIPGKKTFWLNMQSKKFYVAAASLEEKNDWLDAVKTNLAIVNAMVCAGRCT